MTTESEAFEAWYSTVLMPNLDREESGQYCSPQTWAAFRAWQACAERKDRRIAELEHFIQQIRDSIGHESLERFIEKHGNPVPIVMEVEKLRKQVAELTAERDELKDRDSFLLAATREAQAFASKYADEVMDLREDIRVQEVTIVAVRKERDLLQAHGPTMQRGTNGDGTPWMGTMRECLDDALDCAKTEARMADMRSHELASERHKIERLVDLLSGIHALLCPPQVTLPDGRTFAFRYPGDPHEMWRELSDRIRALPDAIDAAMKDAP